MSSTLVFHSVHGCGVRIAKKQTVAKTNMTTFTTQSENGFVFSHRPIQTGESISLKIIKFKENAAIRIGFTKIDPICLPKSFLSQSTEGLFRPSEFWTKEIPSVSESSIFSYLVTQSGDVILEINSRSMGLILSQVDTGGLLWAVIDLSGHTTSVQLMGNRDNRVDWLQDIFDRLSWKHLPREKQADTRTTKSNNVNDQKNVFIRRFFSLRGVPRKNRLQSLKDKRNSQQSPLNKLNSNKSEEVTQQHEGLAWTKMSGVLGSNTIYLKLTNVPRDMDTNQIKAKFPGSVSIKMDGGIGMMMVHYETGEDADKAYEESDLIKLGNNTLRWIQVNELYVHNVTGNVMDSEILRQFPTAKKICWQEPGHKGNRICMIEFRNESERRKAYEDSEYSKIKDQIMNYYRRRSHSRRKF